MGCLQSDAPSIRFCACCAGNATASKQDRQSVPQNYPAHCVWSLAATKSIVTTALRPFVPRLGTKSGQHCLCSWGDNMLDLLHVACHFRARMRRSSSEAEHYPTA